jgi:DNA-directed RNA polymerase specialized sigma24 family protein
VKREARVIRAMDDLANELCLYLLRLANDSVVEDPQGSLYGTIQEVEATFRPSSGVSNTKTRSSTAKSAAAAMRAVDMLPQQQRDMLGLHLVEGLTCLEIAERTQQAREAVMFELVRAYSHLRLHLGGDLMLSIYDRK